MSLPSGYTRLEYIESTGTQYIDTGFKPTGNSKLEVTFQTTQTMGVVIGCDSGWMSNGFMVALNVSSFNTGSNSYSLQDGKKHTVAMESGALTVDGNNVGSAGSGSFTGNATVCLFTNNRSGTKDTPTAQKQWGAKLWENGVLQRDFIPCKNASGAVGMWDDVNSKFYANAGTGTFAEGPSVTGTNTTLINGTSYDVKGGKCLVNGTVYSVKKGRTLISGTGYDITLPGIGIRVSTLSVGQSVYMKVNGAAKEFIVVHQGKPSSLYDNSCDGTWLLMKDIYENRKWHSSRVNNLENSTIHSYLNGTFLNLFESNIRDAIKQVKLPYRKNGGSGGSDQSGANGLLCKIFLLSGYEVGLTTSDNQYSPQDGAKLSYFESGNGSSAKQKRIAKLNGSAAAWWLRSPYTNGTDIVWLVYSVGSCGSAYAPTSIGVRPALILRSDALVDDEFNIIS